MNRLKNCLIIIIALFVFYVPNVNALNIGDIINYDYKGEAEEYIIPYTGLYKLQVWGAEGGYRTNASYSGKGGYSEGVVKLKKGDKIYIYVGGFGGSGSNGCGSTICPGGFNGGGYRYKYYGGGGATDIRINSDSLYARVIVAGGGGSDGATNKYGMAGGGTTGLSSTERCTANDNYCGKGGNSTYSGYSKDYTISTQTKTGLNSNTLANYAGGFGFGGGGTYLSNGYGGAGGGGWYGGSGTIPDGSSDDDRGGGGGSGYVYTEETASYYPTGNLLTSKYYLSEASTSSGDTTFLSPTGTNEIGHTGNGYARVTFLDYAGPTFSEISVLNAIIDEPIVNDNFEYHVQIPNNNFQTKISVTPRANEKYVGAGDVTLVENQVHNIIIINDEGELNVYNLIPYIKRADLDNITFDEFNFNFISYIHDYNVSVSNEVKSVTPHITAKDGITYRIEGDLQLKIGDNIIKVIATDGDATTTYTFIINREFAIFSLSGIGYESTGEVLEYITPGAGTYTFELWGASGGYSLTGGKKSNLGGAGAYTKGTIHLDGGIPLYIYIGGKGADAQVGKVVPGGYNGGGSGEWDHGDDEAAGGGGGATDIRLVGGDWNDFESLKSRIMVAAGGGGASEYEVGGYGGALKGGDTPHNTGGTQTTGYAFGRGADALYSTSNQEIGGGGSGYYGGTAIFKSGGGSYRAAGGGGSSFVSGCVGCNAIAKNSTSTNIIHTGLANHYSDYVFSNIVMKAGNESMPTFDNKGTMTGNANSGYAKISVILDEEEPPVYLNYITTDKGDWDQPFDKDILEYTINLDPLDTKVKVMATTNDYNAQIEGIGDILIESGNFDHKVILTDKYGDTQEYTLHFVREINSYKYLDDILINGVSIPDFEPNKFEYNVTVPYNFDYVHITGITNNDFQKVLNDGVFILEENTLSQIIVAVPESGTPNQYYTINVEREKSSKLKELNVKTVGVNGLKFNDIDMNYELEVFDSVLSLDLEAIPYYKGASITIEGNKFLEDSIIITSHVDGVEDSIYTIDIKRTNEANFDDSYTCTGKSEEFVAPYSGYYKISLWGAAGGRALDNERPDYLGGEGAYTSGTIFIKQGDALYFNVGCKGGDAGVTGRYDGGVGGYNGGGKGGNDTNNDDSDAGGGGGGATDVRVLNGSWNTPASLRSRIMVAAGASGGADYSLGASGGGLIGYKPYNNNSLATQTSGYAYGYGAAGQNSTSGGGGAGGGYYGGYAASGGYSGGSGSSYISGHAGSIGTDELGRPNVSTYTSIEDSYNNSGLYFIDTTMIDGTGYLWTTSKSYLELMPNPNGGYFASGKGNPGDGYANIKLLKALSSNNYLDSLEVKIGDRVLDLSPNFETWVNEYSLNLNTDEPTIEIFASPKDKLAEVTGTGKHDIAPGNSIVPIIVTSTDGSVRTYNINVYREPSNDPTPKDIKIKGMTTYICNDVDPSYCSYKFDVSVEDYEITVPFAITKLELIPILKSSYQEVIYYGYDGSNYNVIDNTDDEGNQNSSLKVDLNSGINKFIIEIVAENGEDSTLYYYDITRDPTGNTNVSDIRIVDPNIEYPFAPLIYEYYITLDETFTKDEVTFEVDKELEDATVEIIGNTNLVKGLNECYVIITAPNGESKTYIYHIYKSASANVYLSNLEVKDGDVTYSLSPYFDKIINDYLLNITSVNNLEIIATPENANATVNIDKPTIFVSGINQVVITVTNGDASNIYYLNIVKSKSSNASLSSLKVLEYTGIGEYALDKTFNKDVLDYAITIPKNIRKVKINAIPEESTTICTPKGNTSLINNISNITITCVAEDKTTKIYNISAVKDLSDNNRLKDIEISTGEGIGVLNPTFDPEVFSYDINVSDNIDRINIKGILADASASVIGNGFYSLVKGNNIIELVVTSELGSKQTYTINVHKSLNDDNTLKEIKNDQNSTVSHPTSDSYTINVQYNVKKITIEGIPNNSNARVSGNGTYNLDTGNNPITITVTSEAGSIANYTVNVIRDLSDNDDLAYLYVKEGALNPVFKDTTIFYDVYVGPSVTSLTLDYEPEDKNARVKVTGNENFVVGENLVVITVTAESGKQKNYTLNVIRQDTTEDVINELLLKSFNVNHELIANFNETTYLYELIVPNTTTDITIDGEAKNENHIVTGAGPYNLRVGKNVLHLAVLNSDGIRKDYQLIVTREKSDDATLSALVVKGSILSPTFAKDTTNYTLTTSENELTFTTITPTEEEATYEILNNSDFTTASTTDVIIRVTSPSKNVTKDYILTVTKSPSNNNNLASLEAVGYTLIPTFHKVVTVYTLTVENDVNNLVINATSEDENATIIGIGLHELNVGTNNIPIKVTSESLKEKIYTVIVTKKSNDNNYLQELYVSEGDLNPAFDSKTYEYSITVPYETDEITITGTPEVNTSTVKGFNSYPLKVGVNNFNVVVTSEASNERIYKVIVTREELLTAKLESLSVKNYDLDSEFSSDYFDYYINVPNEITSIDVNDIKAIPIDKDNTKVEIIGDLNDLKIGMNKISIKVTSTKNNDITENYNLYINRQLSSNNKLISLSVSEGTLTPAFNQDEMNYIVNVPNNIDKITVEALADINSVINDTTNEFTKEYNLVTGENKILIKVRSMIGNERVYTLKVNRALSSNNYLSSLEVKNGDEVLKINPKFDKNETNYTLTVNSDIKFVNINALVEDSKSIVSGLGTKELTSDVNTYNIVVTSEDGNTKIYTIVINRILSSNANVVNIIPSVGNFTESFTPGKKDYTLNVTDTDLFLSFDVQVEDALSTITGNEEQVIPMGTSTRIITVTAEDGTENKYNITVKKENSAEARLESLTIDNYPFEFNSDTFTYNIAVSKSKKKLLESELTAIAKDPDATINMMGDLNLTDGIVNIYTIEVIAKDGYTTQAYTLNITRDSEEYTLRTNKYEIVRFEDESNEDYVIGIQPSTVINDFKNNFENDPLDLKVYLDTIESLDTDLTATALILKLEKNGYVYDTLRVIVRGDLTKDGKVNITDQVKMINYVGRTTTFDKYQMLAGDLTFDGKVNITDQVKIINYVGRTISDLNNKPTS